MVVCILPGMRFSGLLSSSVRGRRGGNGRLVDLVGLVQLVDATDVTDMTDLGGGAAAAGCPPNALRRPGSSVYVYVDGANAARRDTQHALRFRVHG